MALIDTGNSTAGKANVDSNFNLQVNMPTTATQAGFVKLLDENAAPITTSGAFGTTFVVGSVKNRLKIGSDTMYIYDPIDGATINPNIWGIGLTTANFTVTQTTGVLTINAAASTTANSGSVVYSIKQIQRPTTFPVVARWLAKVPNQAITNGQMEMGFGQYATIATSGVAAVTDGAYFRFTSAGFFAVQTFNGVETVSASLSAPSTAPYHAYMVVRKATSTDYYVDDALIVSISTPSGNPAAVSQSRLNMFFRAFNNTGSGASAAPQILIGESCVFQEDLQSNKTWDEQLSGLSRNAIQGSSATSFTQLANHANSASPSSATLSNTAAGYTTLGGRYQFAAPASAVTDFVLFGYQVPAGLDLYITAINITAMNTGAAVATTATILDWSVAVNSSAVSLATADAAATTGVAQTWSPRRMALGMHGFIVTAGIGVTSPDIVRLFPTPLVCNGGRFVQIIVQVPLGTNTASQIIRGDVMISGFFE